MVCTTTLRTGLNAYLNQARKRQIPHYFSTTRERACYSFLEQNEKARKLRMPAEVLSIGCGKCRILKAGPYYYWDGMCRSVEPTWKVVTIRLDASVSLPTMISLLKAGRWRSMNASIYRSIPINGTKIHSQFIGWTWPETNRVDTKCCEQFEHLFHMLASNF